MNSVNHGDRQSKDKNDFDNFFNIYSFILFFSSLPISFSINLNLISSEKSLFLLTLISLSWLLLEICCFPIAAGANYRDFIPYGIFDF